MDVFRTRATHLALFLLGGVAGLGGGDDRLVQRALTFFPVLVIVLLERVLAPQLLQLCRDPCASLLLRLQRRVSVGRRGASQGELTLPDGLALGMAGRQRMRLRELRRQLGALDAPLSGAAGPRWHAGRGAARPRRRLGLDTDAAAVLCGEAADTACTLLAVAQRHRHVAVLAARALRAAPYQDGAAPAARGGRRMRRLVGSGGRCRRSERALHAR